MTAARPPGEEVELGERLLRRVDRFAKGAQPGGAALAAASSRVQQAGSERATVTPTGLARDDTERVVAAVTLAPAAPGDPELGSATVLVALWVVVLTVLGAAATVGASLFAVRTTVAAAADLGALAEASGVLEAVATPCARAASVIEANGASMTVCRLVGSEVWVEARAPAPAAVAWLLPGRGGSLGARAHAELVPDATAG